MEGTDAPVGVDVRPWPGILTQPRAAVRAAVADRRWWPVLVLAASPAASWCLDELAGVHAAAQADAPTESPTQRALFLVLGVALYPFFAFVLPWGLGRLVGGRGTLGDVFFAMVWALLPVTLADLGREALARGLFGSADPYAGFDFMQPASLLSLPPTALLLVALGLLITLWSLGLQTVALSEVHRIRNLRALLVVLAPRLVLFLMGMGAALIGAILALRGDGAG